MTPDEAVVVLATASGYDERNPSLVQAQIWAEDLTEDRIGRDEAVAAVKRYYRDNPDGRVKPGHIAPIVGVLRAERRAAARADRMQEVERRQLATRGARSHLFEPLLAEDWRPPLVLRCAACGQSDAGGSLHIRDRTADVDRLLRALRDRLPEGDPKFRRSLESHRAAR